MHIIARICSRFFFRARAVSLPASLLVAIVTLQACGGGGGSAAPNATAPGAPSGITATVGNGSALVSWTPPAAGGSAITGYTVTASPDGASVTVAGTATSATITGLVNGTAYTFTVVATNAVGSGPVSSPTAAIVPVAVPGAAAPPVAAAGNGSATVSWSAPSSDGSPITGYTISAYVLGGTGAALPAGLTASAGAGVSSIAFPGLVNGTAYAFTVTAANAVGSGLPSALSNTVTPAAVPGAPTAPTASGGNGSALVGWAPPADNGSVITGYTVTASSGAAVTVAGTAVSATLTGLNNGTSYTFTVTAINSVGSGPASAPSPAVTPAAVPGAPANVTAIAGDGLAVVSWSAPASAGGSAITGYTVTASGGASVTVGGGVTVATISGLSDGTPYTFTVTATNALGTGLPSVATPPVTPASVPGAPAGVTASAGNGSALVSWTAPPGNGSAIISYAVTPAGGAPVTVAGTVTSTTVTGLSNGSSYTFTVTASNGVGTGPASAASAPVVPAAVPGAPTGVTATAAAASALVSWTAPASGGSPISGYTVTPGGTTPMPVGGSATSATITGLSNGSSYAFTVAAINAVGTGLPSAASPAVTPAAVPDAPAGVSASASAGSALVSWTAPAANGSAITGYTVTASSGVTASIGGTATSLTFNGLVNGSSYTFTVAATNGVGTGAASAASAPVTPLAVPGAPINVLASGGNAQASVSWTPPAVNGGSAITGYTVTANTGASATVSASPPATSLVFAGLTNGTPYTFTVSATNVTGAGPASAPSAPVTPATVPDAPVAVMASPGNSTAFVTWTAPASNGGSPVTAYTVATNTGATASAAGSATSLTFPGLTNGTAYTFTVSATNGVGTSVLSTASAPVTPSTTAVGITISPRQGGITLSQTQQYTATVTGTANTAVLWSVDGAQGGNATVGTIGTTGLYTPPTTGGAHVITATSQADTTKLANATLGVTDLAGVFTYHNDIARTGQNLQEYALNTTTVPASFGKLFACPVDGVVYAQPLYVANLNLGSNGVHNVVFVVTMNDSVYAFDADDPGCVVYWYQNFLPVGATAVPVTDTTSAGDIPGTYGIMGTPVIGKSTIYFVARYKTTATATFTEQIFALNIATGNEIVLPATIAPSVPGNAQGGTTVMFNPLTQAQRPALLLLGTNVYVAFGSAGDNGNYNGWLVAYDATTLAQTALYNSDPNGGTAGRGGFWLCGSGPASDGTSIFVATANGIFDDTGNVIPPVAPLNDMGDSLLKLSPSLVVQDFFTPFDQANDYANDIDFGSAGVVVLPDSMGSTAHPHLVIAMGKPGKIYMDDRDTMAHYQPGSLRTDANVQTVIANGGGIWSTPAVWGGYVYLVGYSARLWSYPVVNGVIGAVTMQSPDTISQLGATPSISAMGTGQSAANNPIVWVLDNGASGATFSGSTYGPAILKAFDATNLGARLYSSDVLPADAAGYAVKFTVPTVANGKVYVAGAQSGAAKGTTGQLTVYGLLP